MLWFDVIWPVPRGRPQNSGFPVLFLERKPPSNDPLISRQSVEHRGLEHRAERCESSPKRIKTTRGKEGEEEGGRKKDRGEKGGGGEVCVCVLLGTSG